MYLSGQQSAYDSMFVFSKVLFKVMHLFLCWQDEKDEELKFGFDKVFYPDSEQAEVFGFVALPIIKGIYKNSCLLIQNIGRCR